MIGIHEYLRRLSGDSFVNQTRDTLTCRLMELLGKNAKPDWCWFEEELSYDNAKLSHALILSGHATGNDGWFSSEACTRLRWLNELQISEKGHFRPIGSNGFYSRGGARANFDQQPIEAQAMVSACLEAYRATSDVWWYEQAQRAFDWFLGWNDLGLELYSPESGGCGDGLHVDRVNGNQGAESTLAFLLSLAEMRLAQNMLTSFKEPIAVGAVMESISYSRSPLEHDPQARPDARALAALSPRAIRNEWPGSSTRIMSLPEDQVAALLAEVSAEFSERHQHIRKLFLERFEQVREMLPQGRNSPNQGGC